MISIIKSRQLPGVKQKFSKKNFETFFYKYFFRFLRIFWVFSHPRICRPPSPPLRNGPIIIEDAQSAETKESIIMSQKLKTGKLVSIRFSTFRISQVGMTTSEIISKNNLCFYAFKKII